MKKIKAAGQITVISIGLVAFGPIQAQPEVPIESVPKEVDALIRPHSEAGLFSAAILITHDGEIIFEEEYGFANWELRVPITQESRFGIASVTKPMTEILVRQLAEEGRVDLDAPVEQYISGFPTGPEGGKATVRNLLEHRAGVPHRVTEAVEESQPLSPSEIVERVRRVGLLFEPGTDYLYSSAGYTSLARLVEVIEKRPFHEVLEDRIFCPAGMDRATDEVGNLLIPDRALSYGLGAHDGDIVVKNAQLKNLHFLTGAGSVYASARDLLKFLEALASGKFGEERRRELTDANEEWVEITGRTNGYEAYVDYLPSKGIAFVMLSNLQSATNWQARERIHAVLTGRPASIIPFPPTPVSDSPLQPEAAEGVYGPATISVVNDAMYRGDNEIYYIGGGKYYIPASGTVMRFRTSSSGDVDALVSIRGSGDESVLERTDRR